MMARRVAWFVALAVFGTLAFIGPGPAFKNDNVITRLALAFAILDDGTLHIDRFAPFTIDKAEHDGHAYADKAPGSSLLAVPVLAGVEMGLRLRGDEARGTMTRGPAGRAFSPAFAVGAWAVSVVLSALPTGVAAGVLVLLGVRLGLSLSAAALAGVAFGLGTPMAIWGTVFFGHALAGSLLVLGYAACEVADGPVRGAVAGFVLAWAVSVEFTVAPAVAMIAIAALLRGPGWRTVGGAVLGGAIGLAPLLIYNSAAFGGPFSLGYADVQGFAGMRSGFFGVGVPRGDVALALLVGPARGLLWIAPFLVLAPVGWFVMRPAIGAVQALAALSFLLINAGYVYWDGGHSTGPRHLTAAMGFLCLPVGALWDRAGVVGRAVIEGLVAVSVVIALACALVDAASPPLGPGRSPLLDHILPGLLRGEVHNVLTGLHVPGLLSLLGLPVIWLAAALASLGRRPFQRAG